MTSPAITITNLTKRFRLYTGRANSLKELLTRRGLSRFEEYWALRGVTLEIPKGSMYGLIGHNGSGKSTLLRCITGIYRPTAGSVKVTGRISALLELGSGFHPDLTGRENIYLNAAILGMSPREIDEAFPNIVEFAGLTQFIDAPVKVYSSGMYVRLGFAVAVNVRPDILIIDEVIAVGDEEFQRRCFDYLYELRQRGTTIVVVSHSLDLIRSMCDHAAWLDHGLLLHKGPASEVVASYLRHVNEREHEKVTTSQDNTLSPDRVGTGELRVTGVELRDGENRVVGHGVSGEPLTIRLKFFAHRPIKNPVFGLTISKASELVTGTSTHLDSLVTGVVEGEGYVDYVIDALMLTPQTYEVGIAVQDEHLQHHFDRAERLSTLTVRPPEGPAARGVVNLGGSWTLPRSFSLEGQKR